MEGEAKPVVKQGVGGGEGGERVLGFLAANGSD